MLDEEKLKLPDSEFNNYIESAVLDELDKLWLKYWKVSRIAFNYDSEEMITTARLVHYLGFLSGWFESEKKKCGE